MRRLMILVLVVAAGCSTGASRDDQRLVSSTEPTTGANTAASDASPTTSAATAATTSNPPARPLVAPTTSVADSTRTTTTTTFTATTFTTTTFTTTTTAPGPRTISMAFSGDTLPHSPLWRRAATNAAPIDGYDFGPMLAGLAPLLDTVDLAVCHLETPIVPLGDELSTDPYYGVPPEITDAIVAAGYDRCSTASNHAADRGTAGVDRTVDALEAVGLGQSGMARRPAEIRPAVFDVHGVSVCHLSYTFSYNGLSFPDGEEWRSAVIDPLRIIADARDARTLGADVVVVSMHWGAEGVHEPTAWQRRIADEITSDGNIDLVVGHHAHVVQPIELINDTWVMFGLGNILSNLPTSSDWPDATQDAAVVTVELKVDENGTVSIERPVVIPTWVDREAGWVVRLVDDELDRDDIGAGQRGRLERSRQRTERVLGGFMTAAP